MNTIMVHDCSVLPYSKKDNGPFVMEESAEKGKTAKFRILEAEHGRQNPQNWFCVARRAVAEQIEKMKLSVGSNVVITGNVSVYVDPTTFKETRSLKVLSIDYDKKPEKPREKKDDTAELDSALVESVSFA